MDLKSQVINRILPCIILIFCLFDLSNQQSINEDSPYALHPARYYKPHWKRYESRELNRRPHRRNHRNKIPDEALVRHKVKSSRTTFNSDYNLQRDYIATTVGKEIQLDCKIRNLANDDGKIVWLKMPKGEILTLNGNRVTQDRRIESKCNQNQVPCWSLMIKDVRESDTGFYVCQTNSMQTKYIYLDVMVPPKLLTNYPVDRIDVNRSMNAKIECEFYGKPEPLIKWYKYENGNQKEIEMYRGHSKVDLMIDENSPSEYECVADNSIPPTVSKKIHLNIQYPPSVNFMNTKVYQKLGENIIFDCDVQSNPISRVFWFKNHSRIHESNKYRFELLENNFYRLFINNLTKEDFGTYHLRAVNVVGKAATQIELIEIPDEKVPEIIKTTTSSRSAIEVNRIGVFNVDSGVANKTEIILSQIYNSEKKNMKNKKKIEDNSGEISDFYSSKKPVRLYNRNKNHTRINWYKNRSKNNKLRNKYHTSYENFEEKQKTSTLTYHILQIENGSHKRLSFNLMITCVSYIFFKFIYFMP